MSRIGRLPINVPQGTQVNIKGNSISVKGPKGQLERTIDSAIHISLDDNKVILESQTDQNRQRALHGLYRSLISNMITGVNEPFKIKLEIVGIGFRAAMQGQNLELALGYSHTVIFELPKEIKAIAATEKGKPPSLILECYDKELLGLVVAKIRSLRKPDVYKGKGVRYENEQLRLKPGKAAAGASSGPGK